MKKIAALMVIVLMVVSGNALAFFIVRCEGENPVSFTVPNISQQGLMVLAGQTRIIAKWDTSINPPCWVLSSGNRCANGILHHAAVSEKKRLEVVALYAGVYVDCIINHSARGALSNEKIVDLCRLAAEVWSGIFIGNENTYKWPLSPDGSAWPMYRPSRGSNARLKLRLRD